MKFLVDIPGFVYGDATVGTYDAATAASVALLWVCLHRIVISVMVYHGRQLYQFQWAGHDTQVTSLASLCVHFYNTFESGHCVCMCVVVVCYCPCYEAPACVWGGYGLSISLLKKRIICITISLFSLARLSGFSAMASV